MNEEERERLTSYLIRRVKDLSDKELEEYERLLRKEIAELKKEG